MRVFLAAVLAAIVLGIGAVLVLGLAQRTAAVAYSTDGARINPKWGWRQIVSKVKGPVKVATGAGLNPAVMASDHAEGDSCSDNTALRWLFVDFGEADADESGCN